MNRRGLGFGGAVGLGLAVSLLIGVITIGHAVFRQVAGAAAVVVTFAEVALCVLLGAAALGVLGLLGYRGQLARLHLAERRIAVEQAERQAAIGQGAAHWAVRAEVLGGAAEGAPEGLCHNPATPVDQGIGPVTVTGRHLRALPGPEGGDNER